jgi:hypothetical protein
LLRFWTILFIGLLTASGVESSPKQLNWLAFGDLRGYLEPCGCDPRTDMGGLKRLSKVLKREASIDPSFLLLDLGNNTPTDPLQSKSKTKFMLSGLNQLNPDASLFNQTEMLTINEIESVTKQPPYVLSNGKFKSKSINLKVQIKTKNTIILGYVWNKNFEKSLVKVDKILLKKYSAIVSKSNLNRILLFSGPDTHLKKFVEANIFDEIISSNTTPLDRPLGPYEKDDESKLNRPIKKRIIRMVPVGGQGILRGGKKLTQIAPALSGLIQISPSPQSKDNLFKKQTNVSWLTKDEEGPDQLKDLFKAYNDSQKGEFKRITAERKLYLANSSYVGSESCKTCHADQFKKWESSNHSKAYTTLVKKNKSEDWECVSCHVVGSKEKGGFVSISDSPHLANVQCENCHGPRRSHLTNPKNSQHVDAKKVCSSCHHLPHSSDFNFKKYWAKIKH